ncbi:MAG: D-alanyl-D-alanine carboxypeptidase [Rhizobacter sp.]|nr:D-alanyl-D-alanine carboxypeptidase [Ferruginibacter sp.]
MKRVFQLSYSLLLISYSLFLPSCSVNKQINKQAQQLLFADSSISHGHIGISVYDPSTGKYLYNHNADKYFIPASNTKLFSWYAGMKYLADSLVGLRHYINDYTKQTYILPAGDPTFLLPEFSYQPVLSFLEKADTIHLQISKTVAPYGNGWAWNDYMDDYMTPRSEFPVFGNRLSTKWISNDSIQVYPEYFKKISLSGKSFRNITRFNRRRQPDMGFVIVRSFDANDIQFLSGDTKEQVISFYPDPVLVSKLLEDTLKKQIDISSHYTRGTPIYSQPSDSLFKPMMHRSDNFFAEQTLLMASNEYLGYMSDRNMIDTMLKTTLKDIPQKPRWVDGSGLSRYNLFTPQDFVWLLNKTKNEFSWERIKNILPTGGEGTLSSYYKNEAGFIYAKTGTLSNNCALSGYLITKKNKLLIFSVLVNNYPGAATPVRRAVEKFIKNLREKY